MSWNKLSSVFVTFCPAESWSIKVWVCWPEWHAHTQSPLWDKLHLCSTFLKCLQMLYGKKVNCIKWWGRQSKAGKDKPREKNSFSVKKKYQLSFLFVHTMKNIWPHWKEVSQYIFNMIYRNSKNVLCYRRMIQFTVCIPSEMGLAQDQKTNNDSIWRTDLQFHYKVTQGKYARGHTSLIMVHRHCVMFLHSAVHNFKATLLNYSAKWIMKAIVVSGQTILYIKHNPVLLCFDLL